MSSREENKSLVLNTPDYLRYLDACMSKCKSNVYTYNKCMDECATWYTYFKRYENKK